MTYDYANRKGYEGLGYSLISLIPLGGFLYFYKLPKRRNVSKEGFRQIYRPKEIFAKFIIYAQIVFVAVIVIVPIIYIFEWHFLIWNQIFHQKYGQTNLTLTHLYIYGMKLNLPLGG